jgi:hypothetical protein
MAVMAAHALGTKTPTVDGTELKSERDKKVIFGASAFYHDPSGIDGIVAGPAGPGHVYNANAKYFCSDGDRRQPQ